MGVVASRTPGAGGATRMRFLAPAVSEGLEVGASVAVNGCCLTAVACGESWWEADVVAETLARTNLGEVAIGAEVNLERPVRAGGHLDGHMVQGHVDGVGYVLTPAPDLTLSFPPGLTPYIVEKGSVTVDGVSLTVTAVTAESFCVAIIPHTATVTTLGSKEAGAAVNLEADVIAKYVERLLAAGVTTPYPS